MDYKLQKIEKAKNLKKKLQAVFINKKTGRTKITQFGASGMSDYTINKDKERRSRYRSRHQKDLNTNDPTKAGYLSYYILWGDSTNKQQNIKNYKSKFNL